MLKPLGQYEKYCAVTFCLRHGNEASCPYPRTKKDLKVELVQADLRLKDRQASWETTRNIMLFFAAVAGIAGVLGFKIGQKDEGRQPVNIIFQPGSIVAPPAPAPIK